MSSELKKAERILTEPIGIAIVLVLAVVFVIPYFHKKVVAEYFKNQPTWVQSIVYFVVGGVLVSVGYYYLKGIWKSIAEALGIGFFFAGGLVLAGQSIIPVKTS